MKNIENLIINYNNKVINDISNDDGGELLEQYFSNLFIDNKSSYVLICDDDGQLLLMYKNSNLYETLVNKLKFKEIKYNFDVNYLRYSTIKESKDKIDPDTSYGYYYLISYLVFYIS